jgi:hypothetical protein
MNRCHCKDKRACNQVTGQCQTPGCLAGWQGVACANGKKYVKTSACCTSLVCRKLYFQKLNKINIYLRIQRKAEFTKNAENVINDNVVDSVLLNQFLNGILN